MYDDSLYNRSGSGPSFATGSKVWEMELLVEQIRLLE